MKNYSEILAPSATPQTEPIPGREQDMVRNAAGLYTPRGVSRFAHLHAQWGQRYRDGASLSQIAQSDGVSVKTVHRAIKRAGLSRTVSESKRLGSKVWPHAGAIAALYETGASITQIVEQFGGNRAAVWNVLQHYGVTRSGSQASRVLRDRALPNSDFFDAIENEQEAYWLGFICADATIERSLHTARLSLELSKTDRNHLSAFARIFNMPITERVRQQKSGYVSHMVKCAVNSVHIYESLQAMGVTPNKSLSPVLANAFNFIPTGLTHHFIRGYFDGDGSIAYKPREYCITQFVGNERFLSCIRDRLSAACAVSLGYLCKAGNIHRLAWTGGRACCKIATWLYDGATIYLERKRARFAALASDRGVCL